MFGCFRVRDGVDELVLGRSRYSRIFGRVDILFLDLDRLACIYRHKENIYPKMDTLGDDARSPLLTLVPVCTSIYFACILSLLFGFGCNIDIVIRNSVLAHQKIYLRQ